MTTAPTEVGRRDGNGEPGWAPCGPGGNEGGQTANNIGDRVQLVASAEAAVVFASLAAHCVPDICDSIVVDISEAGAQYRIAYPPVTAKVGLVAGTIVADQVVRLHFTHRSGDPDDSGDPDGAGRGTCCRDDSPCSQVDGDAVFMWRHRVPAASDRLLAAALVEQAMRVVAWQRSEQRARAAEVRADNLTLALQTSRRIGAAVGILMSLHKITEPQAFDLLRAASQHSHRKLRDLALDVIDTGWLDPALIDRGATHQMPERRLAAPH